MFPHLHDRRKTAGQLQVASGIVCHASPIVGQDVHVLVVDMDAVSSDDFGLEQADALQPAYRRHVLFFDTFLHLEGCLGNVDLERNVVSLSHPHRLSQDLGCAHIGRMRRRNGGDQLVIAPTAEKALTVR